MKYCDNSLTQCESWSQLSITAVNQRPHGRHQSYYKSSNLIKGAIISKMTTSTLFRGPKFRDWEHNDSLKKCIDLVFHERVWGFLNLLKPGISWKQHPVTVSGIAFSGTSTLATFISFQAVVIATWVHVDLAIARFELHRWEDLSSDRCYLQRLLEILAFLVKLTSTTSQKSYRSYWY